MLLVFLCFYYMIFYFRLPSDAFCAFSLDFFAVFLADRAALVLDFFDFFFAFFWLFFCFPSVMANVFVLENDFAKETEGDTKKASAQKQITGKK